MSVPAEQDVGSCLTGEQRNALRQITEQLKELPRGGIAQSDVRINLLWEVYLISLQAEVEAVGNPQRMSRKDSTAAERRSALLSLRNHIGRPATVEDLISSFAPHIKIDDRLTEVLRDDLDRLQHKAVGRTLAEVFDGRVKKIERRRAKSKKPAKKRVAKKKAGDKKGGQK